jgi:hypothetical protein
MSVISFTSGLDDMMMTSAVLVMDDNFCALCACGHAVQLFEYADHCTGGRIGHAVGDVFWVEVAFVQGE